MDNKEFFFYARVGFKSDTAAWDGKAVIGWVVTDTAVMAPATGALTIASGGGMGFHVGEDGVLGYFTGAGAITSTNGSTSVDITTLDAADTFQWYTLGVRTRFIDASASTGVTDFYVNGNNVATVEDSTTMASTPVYSVTTAILNGPARDSDMAVDYVVTGMTRSGITYPYDTGNY
tara:strand:- start:14132 stop:14659 length:528 start_codon:yes stop_codon:yes gene_type:complete